MRLFNSSTSRYDTIISRDMLKYGFVLDHACHTVTWDGLTIEMAQAIPQQAAFQVLVSRAHFQHHMFMPMPKHKFSMQNMTKLPLQK